MEIIYMETMMISMMLLIRGNTMLTIMTIAKVM